MTNTTTSEELSSAITKFLKQHAPIATEVIALPSDASARKYYRLQGQGQLLMEDSSNPKGFAAFIQLASHLSSMDLSAPTVIATAPEAGIALIEDFGADTYANVLKAGYDENALYALAVDTLLHLHKHPRAVEVTVPHYTMSFLLDEISVFSEWFVPAFDSSIDVQQFRKTFRDLWSHALAPLKGHDNRLVLRDFHIDNLMLLGKRHGVQACGLLDFQDAVTGPAEYDLVSLLQDARRDLARGLEEQMLQRYIASAPIHAGTEDEIRQRYYVLGAQRHTRLTGQFLRLHQRDGKPGYLKFMPRVMRQMQTALQTARLTEIEEFIDTSLPGWRDAGAALSQPA